MSHCSLIGLILTLSGAVLLWWFPRPTPELDDSFGLGLEDGTPLGNGRTVAQERARVQARTKLNYWLSGVGFALSLAGIMVQGFFAGPT